MNPDSHAPRFFRRRGAVVGLIGFASCLLLGTALYHSRPTPVQRLQPYLGRDLRSLSEDEQIRVDELIGCLAPEAKRFTPPNSTRPQTYDLRAWYNYLNAKPHALFSRSWYLWRVQERLVLLQGQPLWIIPNSSSTCVFAFDTYGRKLSKTEFQTG